MDDKVIQTIVMRAKFPDKDGNLRKIRLGKYCAQASHASMAFLSNKFRNTKEYTCSYIGESGCVSKRIPVAEQLSEEESLWIENSFTKICLYVETEEELLDVYNRAKNEGLTVHLIQDSGLTEFDGIPTNTCLAIGPHYKSKIDTITKELKLF